MIKNYILTAWRNLLKNRAFSIINIIGLAISMLVSLLIFAYISFEWSYDKYFPDADRIYRLVNIRHYDVRSDESAGCVVALGPALKESFPEVEQYARCFKTEGVLSYNEKVFREQSIFYADSTFFDIFKQDFLSKVNKVPLSKPNMAVITKSFALKYFGQENPLQKTILLYGRIPFVVEGIIKDISPNTHFHFDIALSFVTLLKDSNYCFGCNNRATYIRLAKNADVKLLESKFPMIIKKIHSDGGFKREYKLQALTDIHLHSKLRFELNKNGDSRQVKILTTIAILVLLIAWFNFINLTTSLLLKRAREVGLRKVLGSTKLNITGQFIIESVLLFFIVIIIDLTLLQIISPFIGKLIGQNLFAMQNFRFWTFVFLIYFLGALVSGILSAQILTQISTLSILKGTTLLKTNRLPLRKIFVFLQFTVSIVLIGNTLAIYKQNGYLINHELGLFMDHAVAFPAPSIIKQGENYQVKVESLLNEWKESPGVQDVGFCSTIPGYESGDVGGGFSIKGAELIQLYNYDVALNYFSFFRIPVICGRLPERYDVTGCVPPCDINTELVINKTAALALGFSRPDSVLGKTLFNEGKPCGTIIGVIEDFNQQSLEKKINPAYFRCSKRMNYLILSISPNNLPGTLNSINQKFTSFFPDNPLEYYFLKEYFNFQYKDDKLFAKLFGLFSLLALTITCLGLLGMILFDSKKRTKEIGVRKVNGARTSELVFLLMKENLVILLLACLIAIPICQLVIHNWLKRFAYQTDIGWWIMIWPILIVLAVTLMTTLSHVINTARANPVDSLKYE